MGQLLRRIAAFLGLISPMTYAYPALDIRLPGDRQFHLVGSIHMGTVDMSPLPAKLAARLKQADALIVEADITGSASPFDHIEQQPELEQRLSESEFQQLLTLCQELGADVDSFSTARLAGSVNDASPSGSAIGITRRIRRGLSTVAGGQRPA